MGLTERGLHLRVTCLRGKASEHRCVDGCGRWALDWSQRHGADGSAVGDYDPRCRSCHAKYDSTAEGRARISRSLRGNDRTVGMKHGQHKLTDDDVIEIRSLYAARAFNQRELGEIYGVHQTRISGVIHNTAWRHVHA